MLSSMLRLSQKDLRLAVIYIVEYGLVAALDRGGLEGNEHMHSRARAQVGCTVLDIFVSMLMYTEKMMRIKTQMVVSDGGYISRVFT